MPDKIDTSDRQIKRVFNFRQKVFKHIAVGRRKPLWLGAGLADVRKVVVITSASRSGSSLLYAILKKACRIYSLAGEAVPFYKLNGFSSDLSLSDHMVFSSGTLSKKIASLSRDFLSDFSLCSHENNVFAEPQLLDEYIDDLVLRFSLQWPQIRFSYDIFKKLASQALRKYARANTVFNKERFYLELIRLLRRKYPQINPYYYDIRQELVKDSFVGLSMPKGPPNDLMALEEPPFILLSPKTSPTLADLADNTLLLKSTVDCYNMPFLQAILPNADIRVIHLSRNPFGSINGLYDGWLFRGFFSHNLKKLCSMSNVLSKELAIKGYSDKYEWGKWWWKYDLPQGWQDYAQKSLVEVCAFQWYSANKAIQGYINSGSCKNSLQIKYENIISDIDRRKTEIKKIFDFIGCGRKEEQGLDLVNLPVIQATFAPKPYRWKVRERILYPLLNDKRILEMSRALGYERHKIKEWL